MAVHASYLYDGADKIGASVFVHTPRENYDPLLLPPPRIFLVIKANINSSSFVLFKLVRPPQTPFAG